MLIKRIRELAVLLTLYLMLIPAFASPGREKSGMERDENRLEEKNEMEAKSVNSEYATLGGGCFWCIEAIFERVAGVTEVISGYAGGSFPDPTYRDVSSGTTGHAEVIQIAYNPDLISYEEILAIFWKAHDPTTLNRQGADVGAQYRSIILYHNDLQRELAEKSKLQYGRKLTEPIVTQIKPLETFYKAEDYHQDYFKKNTNAAYCRIVIEPKLRKLEPLLN